MWFSAGGEVQPKCSFAATDEQRGEALDVAIA